MPQESICCELQVNEQILEQCQEHNAEPKTLLQIVSGKPERDSDEIKYDSVSYARGFVFMRQSRSARQCLMIRTDILHLIRTESNCVCVCTACTVVSWSTTSLNFIRFQNPRIKKKTNVADQAPPVASLRHAADIGTPWRFNSAISGFVCLQT